MQIHKTSLSTIEAYFLFTLGRSQGSFKNFAYKYICFVKFPYTKYVRGLKIWHLQIVENSSQRIQKTLSNKMIDQGQKKIEVTSHN